MQTFENSPAQFMVGVERSDDQVTLHAHIPSDYRGGIDFGLDTRDEYNLSRSVGKDSEFDFGDFSDGKTFGFDGIAAVSPLEFPKQWHNVALPIPTPNDPDQEINTRRVLATVSAIGHSYEDEWCQPGEIKSRLPHLSAATVDEVPYEGWVIGGMLLNSFESHWLQSQYAADLDAYEDEASVTMQAVASQLGVDPEITTTLGRGSGLLKIEVGDSIVHVPSDRFDGVFHRVQSSNISSPYEALIHISGMWSILGSARDDFYKAWLIQSIYDLTVLRQLDASFDPTNDMHLRRLEAERLLMQVRDLKDRQEILWLPRQPRTSHINALWAYAALGDDRPLAEIYDDIERLQGTMHNFHPKADRDTEIARMKALFADDDEFAIEKGRKLYEERQAQASS